MGNHKRGFFFFGVLLCLLPISLAFGGPPAISYTVPSGGYPVGASMSLVPTNTGGAISSCTASPLKMPPGIRFLNPTCSFSGTPTAAAGNAALTTYTYTITATGTGGTDYVSGTTKPTVSFQIANPPVITYPSAFATYLQNQAASTTPVNTGGVIDSCVLTGELPSGLTFNRASCMVSGTPTVNSVSTPYTVTATNAAGSSSATLNIAVNSAPSQLQYPSPAIIQASIFQAITPFAPTSTSGLITSCATVPSLPLGLQIDPLTCTISGTPIVAAPTTEYTVYASGVGGTGNEPVVSIAVNPKPPAISYGTVPSFTVGQAMVLIATNSGGDPTNCTASPTAPSTLALPKELSIDPLTCTIHGTLGAESAGQTYKLTITAANAGGVDYVNGTTKPTVSFSVANATLPALSFSVPSGGYVVGSAMSLVPTNTGGPISSCSISPTTMPTDISFNKATCGFSGTPAVAAAGTTYTYTVKALNSAGTSNPVTVGLKAVNPSAPVLTYNVPSDGYTAGVAMSLVPSSTGGRISSCSRNPTALPAGLSFSAVDCSFSGTPAGSAAGNTYSYTVTAFNSGGTTKPTVTFKVTSPTTVPNISYTNPSSPLTAGAAASIIPINAGGAVTSCAYAAQSPEAAVKSTFVIRFSSRRWGLELMTPNDTRPRAFFAISVPIVRRLP